MKAKLKFKFTETAIAELEPPVDRDRYYVHDTVFTGLCLMVTRGHRKTGKFRRTYYLNCSIDGRSRRLRIGEVNNVSLVQARKKAKVLAGLVESGVDPMQEKRDKRQEMTLDELLEEYLERHAKPYKKTWDQDQGLYRRQLSHWAIGGSPRSRRARSTGSTRSSASRWASIRPTPW
jgi:hypothetical protein